ncbi:MAG: hypothetical protein SF123_07715 [Chloroflexota bacterium]|nr:hypothetical protein [Chloroflexota bacterium]
MLEERALWHALLFVSGSVHVPKLSRKFLYLNCLLVCLVCAAASARLSAQDTLYLDVENPMLLRLSHMESSSVRYAVTEWQRVTISARSMSVPALDLVLAVYDAVGNLLAYNDDRDVPYGDLKDTDPVIADLELRNSTDITIVVRSFTGTGSGEFLLALIRQPPVLTAAEAAQAHIGTQTMQVQVPQFDDFDVTFSAYQGQLVSITAASLTENFDPILELYDVGLALLMSNDDAPPGLGEATRNAHIAGFPLPTTGNYTARVRGFGGAGGNAEVTITLIAPLPTPAVDIPIRAPLLFDAEVGVGTVFEQSFSASAGDMMTFRVQPATETLDPRIAVLDSQRRVIETGEHSGRSSDPLAIERLLIPRAGNYIVQVSGYADAQGPFTLIIAHDASAVPLADPVVSRMEGNTLPGVLFSSTLHLRAGSYVTIGVRSRTTHFDPVVALLSASGEVLARNDDHGSSDVRFGVRDARIVHFPIFVDEQYVIEVGGIDDSAGSFEIIVEVLEP